MSPHLSRLIKGFSLAIAAGFCWGSMSVIGQVMLVDYGFSAEDLGSLRVFGAGVLMSAWVLISDRTALRTLLSEPKVFLITLLYGIGVLLVQYTFFLAIRDANAATAALMVTLAPLFVLSWLALRRIKPIGRAELLAFVLACAGVVLIVTKGDLSRVELSISGILWGLTSAALGAFCTLEPARAIARIGVLAVVGFGMLLSGALSLFFHPLTALSGTFTPLSIAGAIYLVVVGTAMAFVFYLKSLEYVPASISSILAAFEPLSAVLLSVAVLGMSFNWAEELGAALIFAVVLVLAYGAQSAKQRERVEGAQN